MVMQSKCFREIARCSVEYCIVTGGWADDNMLDWVRYIYVSKREKHKHVKYSHEMSKGANGSRRTDWLAPAGCDVPSLTVHTQSETHKHTHTHTHTSWMSTFPPIWNPFQMYLHLGSWAYAALKLSGSQRTLDGSFYTTNIKASI